jgi:4'-phosphopantetheinyl transferase
VAPTPFYCEQLTVTDSEDLQGKISEIGRLILTPWTDTIDAVEGDHVRVVVVPLDNVANQLQELRAVLIDDERARADRFLVPKAHLQFVATRGILRQTLGRLLGVASEKVPIGYIGAGKPVLSGDFDNLHFNVTHTDSLALIALARRTIGIDVERIRPIENAEGLIGRFFSKLEQETFLSLEPAKRPAGFFRGWTCKEAVIKAAGLSVAYLDTFDVELDPDKPASLLAARNPRLLEMDLILAALEPVAGFAAAVAIAGV